MGYVGRDFLVNLNDIVLLAIHDFNIHVFYNNIM